MDVHIHSPDAGKEKVSSSSSSSGSGSSTYVQEQTPLTPSIAWQENPIYSVGVAMGIISLFAQIPVRNVMAYGVSTTVEGAVGWVRDPNPDVLYTLEGLRITKHAVYKGHEAHYDDAPHLPDGIKVGA